MRLKAPLRVVLELTERCNYSCIYCFNSCSPKTVSKDLSLQKWKKIIKRLKQMEVFELSFTGGEPFRYKDIFELLEYANELDFDITINSNASLLNKEKIERLKKIFGDKSKFVRIMVSVDTLNAKRYKEVVRANIDLDKILENINLLVSNGFKVTMTSIFTKKTVKDYSELLQFFLNKKIRSWNISNVIPYGRGARCEEYSVDKNDWNSLRNLLNKYTKEIKKKGKQISVQTNFMDLEELEEITTSSNCFNCPAGKTEMSVGPKGNLYPCITFRGTDKSHIPSNKLREFWKTNSLIMDLRNRNSEALKSICSKCKLKQSCVGGCPGLALRYFGDIFMPDPRCSLLPKIVDISNKRHYIDFIVELAKRNMKGYYLNWEGIDKEIQEEFMRKDITTWLVKFNDKRIGYIMFEKKKPGIFIISLQIEGNEQHNGYGSLILRNLENNAKGEDYKTIRFQVKAKNIPAIKFYKKEGYIEYSNKEDYLYFEKILLEKSKNPQISNNSKQLVKPTNKL